MTSLNDILTACRGTTPITESDLDKWIIDSDISRAPSYYPSDAERIVEEISTKFVQQYLNNNDTNVVPIRRKTKFLLVMNNFALHKPLRSAVFNAIKDLDDIFEESMRTEGKMPFDSELGRMSEHVLVLMMRVLNYKFKAAQVHEFAEHNTQFAVQLLLAVLLKEPPYEFELRCNCISGLLGFTQPQAFFSASEDEKDIKFHECTGFTEKIDFTLELMLRLSAIQVLNDVITAQMFDHSTIQPLEHLAVTNTMRCIMNIFQFSSKGSLQWRQHLLLSTTFVDGATILYIQGQLKALEPLLAVKTNISIPSELLRGLTLALKFAAFATFRLGNHAKALRPLCAFFNNMLTLPVRHLILAANNEKTSSGTCSSSLTQIRSLYANFFYFMSNIDALAGDEDIVEDIEDLIPELASERLRTDIENFIKNELAVAGVSEVSTWHKRLLTIESDALVLQESKTYQDIEAAFSAASKGTATTGSSVGSSTTARAFEDLQSMAKKSAASSEKKKKKKVHSSKAGSIIEQKITGDLTKMKLLAAPAGASSAARFACALNGHTMKVPMLSPYGHNFEKETIEQWINQQGPICPITGKPLHLKDLTMNKELQTEIMAEVIRETMKAANQEDASDLYEF